MFSTKGLRKPTISKSYKIVVFGLFVLSYLVLSSIVPLRASHLQALSASKELIKPAERAEDTVGVFVPWQDIQLAWGDCGAFSRRLTDGGSDFWTNVALHGLAVSGVEFALMSGGVDEALQKRFIQTRSASDSSLYRTPNAMGTTGAALALDIGLYAGGWIGNSPRLRLAARSAVETLLLSGIATTLVKVIAGRARPDVGAGALSFAMLKMDEGHYSLPSGHATVAFATASSLARSADNVFVSVGLYTLASATAAARMYYNKHWFSDVLLGALIGIGSASVVESLHEEALASNNSKSKKSSSLHWTPTQNGVALLLEF